MRWLRQLGKAHLQDEHFWTVTPTDLVPRRWDRVAIRTSELQYTSLSDTPWAPRARIQPPDAHAWAHDAGLTQLELVTVRACLPLSAFTAARKPHENRQIRTAVLLRGGADSQSNIRHCARRCATSRGLCSPAGRALLPAMGLAPRDKSGLALAECWRFDNGWQLRSQTPHL